MNKKEVLELKRRLKKDQATFSRLVGCYVDCNHEKVCKFGGKFLTLEEDEYYKYLEISNKVLSGTLGNKNRSTGPILFTSPSITPAFFAISISPAQNPVTPTSETASTTASREARITPSVTSGIRPCIAPYTMPRSSMELHRTFIASPD